MRCVVCGRIGEHCKLCHFVHDYMGWLDGTVATNNRLQRYPPPWKLWADIEQRVRDAWAEYEIPA